MPRNFHPDERLGGSMFLKDADVQGTVPAPIQNFVEDRKEFTLGSETYFSQTMLRLDFSLHWLSPRQ